MRISREFGRVRQMFSAGVVLLTFALSASAQDGTFDTTFATTGKKVFSILSSEVEATVAVRATSDGKLLIAGDCNDTICLVQLNPDGSLDQSYGTTKLGYFRLDQTGNDKKSSAEDMVLMPDGRAVVLGCDSDGPAYSLFMVKADGSGLDSSIGGGTGYGDFTGDRCPTKIRRHADGKFLALVPVSVSNYGDTMGVQRVQANLTDVDATFGVNGTASVAFGLGENDGGDFPHALAIQPDGKIVIGGSSGQEMGEVFALARLLSTGQLDTSFGNGDGRLHYTGSAPSTNIYDIAIDSEQRVVFGGFIAEAGSTEKRLVGRLTPAGQFDYTFGTTGLAEFPFTSEDSAVQSIALSGQYIVMGSVVFDENFSEFSVSRIDTSGRLVSSFGTAGSTSSNFSASSSPDAVSNVIITSRGIVIAGIPSDLNAHAFGIARLNYEYIFSDSFQ